MDSKTKKGMQELGKQLAVKIDARKKELEFEKEKTSIRSLDMYSVRREEVE